MSETTPKLLPCPFCGNAPRLTDYYGNYNKPPEHVVHCDHCDLSLDGMPSPAKAIALWNRRAPIAAREADPS